MDAAKHLPILFQVELINALTEYSLRVKKKGLVFIMEYIQTRPMLLIRLPPGLRNRSIPLPNCCFMIFQKRTPCEIGPLP